MKTLNHSRKLAARSRANCFLTLFLLAGLLASVTPLRADNPPTYLFQWGSQGTNNGQFDEPEGITIDSSFNIYVADFANNRIEKFDGNGNYLTQWGSQGISNGQFENPNGIAVDSSNNVYVADYDNYRIEKFDDNGNYLTQWGSQGIGIGQFGYVGGIAVDSRNNVYVADESNSRVEKFTSNGNYLIQWGSEGTGNGQFEGPGGIAVDSSNNVYVVDQDNQRVEKFTSNGTYLTQWGSAGSGNGQFEYPDGIAVDSSNNVYVTDTSNQRVQKFTSNGNYLTQWGSVGGGNGQFEGPYGIAVDSTGNFIYVADNGNSRIEVFVNNTNIPPVITPQPTSQSIPIGGNVTFSVGVLSVGVFGTETFVYQWTSNNVALPNATNSTLTLTNISLADAASYAVLVTNNFGGTVSSNAVLTAVPALVITLPASSITTTGTVLNGSVTVGSDETVVWFDWGTDTNYGNIADETVVPGNNGSNNISTVLSGLPGNIYHYRIDAANDFGIVFGNDQSFTNGFAPTATTLATINSTNGTTFNATVNPNGWDTTVYFKWGVPFSLLTNTTPIMDVGAGAAPLNVSSLITSLATAKQYDYQVVASNSLGTVFGFQVAFYSPPFVTVPNQNWNSVASSADGRVLVAVANMANGASPAGPIIISINSGVTWAIATGAPTNGRWETVACSADGSKMIAAGGGGVPADFLFPIYTSSDTGVTWVSNNAPVANWQSVASSADGTRLAAADSADRVIYTSTNSGAVWTQATNAPKEFWYSIALSADGTKLAAVATGLFSGVGGTNIYTSTDFGATWITNAAPKGPSGTIQRNWVSIASSADGNKLVAAGGGYNFPGYIFISTNSGAAWTLTATNILPSGLSGRPWIYVASSADGSKLAAVSDATSPIGGVFISTNSGATWTNVVQSVRPSLTWNAVALSADGAKLVATVGYPSTGPIYVSQTTPSPILNLSASDNAAAISWIIPSLDFTLQQSPDLSSWTDVTNQPALNLTNLQNQVVLPPPDGNSFFRLMH
jgi:DNA-binding beta-propeller fold protein YncE